MAAKRHKRDKNRKTSKSGKYRTPISGHKRVGSDLVPPMLATGIDITPEPWVDNRLPEMLWAVLIAGTVERGTTLDYFRRLLRFIHEHEDRDQLHNMTVSGIANLEEPLRNNLVEFLLTPPWAQAVLAPLIFFEGLPAKQVWEEHLRGASPNIERLMESVGAVLWHQSEAATDCRWVRVMATAVAGRITVDPKLHHTLTLLNEYPADFEESGPRFRAMEIGLTLPQARDLTWPRLFWQEAWERTPCLEFVQEYPSPTFGKTITRDDVANIRERIEEHWIETHSTTAVDPKHDAVFGMALYSIRILEELMGIGIGNSVLGRTGLRTILEVRINLKYLLAENEPELWSQWRRYGAGQAKLNALKFDESVDPPRHISIQSIERIASEDMWEEFLTIDLGGWTDLDLRKMSDKVGLKGEYDQHYSWTSGYTHGMWGPIREACFQVCANPLHRLHRFPHRQPLQDTVDDAASLVDEILQLVDEAYPGFSHRLAAQTAAPPSTVL